ncbi:hypothetical protein [Mycolicibacterium neoaurum]|uniref:hypothetical protein n=1 Tax=Mycolicibacterium neoaurum TaxID=1795 RepID=UPI001F4CB270|nr:hypothetical protein [Mycolicibacterium neoaurum]
MDDAEKTQRVDGEQASQFDPDKTTVVPNTPRPTAPGPDAERTQMVNPTPPPPRPERPTGESRPAPAGAQMPYPPVGPNAQRPPFPPPNPAAGPPIPQSPHTPQPAAPPVQHGDRPGPNLQTPNYGYPAGGPAQQVPPASYGPAAGGPPPSAPTNPGQGAGVQPPPFGTSPQPPQGYGAPDPFGQPGPYAQQYQHPQNPPPGQPGQQQPFPQQPGPVQSPLQAANSALAKGGSFITRLIQRGMYGELIKNPWFQQTRQQKPDPFIYVGFVIGIVVALLMAQLGGLIGDILALVAWAALAYVFFAVGTKKAVQFVAYGICTVGPAIYFWGAFLGFATWSQLTSSPYVSGVGSGIGAIILLQAISNTVFGVAMIWAGITVHRTIKKLSGQA